MPGCRGAGVPGAGCRMPDAGCRMPDAGVPGCRGAGVPDAGVRELGRVGLRRSEKAAAGRAEV